MKPLSKRREFSAAVKGKVAARCQRRCALCFVFKGKAKPRKGQFAHVDRDHSNSSEGNCAFLCLSHHDSYDSVPSQGARIMPNELRAYEKLLFAYLDTPHTPSALTKRRRAAVTLDVYDRRAPIYRATRQFVRDVFENLRPDLKLILKFAADTDEALFLFDSALAEYLETLFKKALRLHTVGLLRERIQTNADEAENFAALVQEETGLAEWFPEQPEEIRARFAPFLRLA
jgi:hypothetical protein